MINIPDELNKRARYFAQEGLSLDDRLNRVRFLAEQMQTIPNDAISKMNYFAAAAGCSNLCQMCSTGSAPNVTRITQEGIEDLVRALGQVARERNIKVSSEREFRPGHILLYFDDDPALNPLTGVFITNVQQELGVKIALSTHGWSRQNTELQAMHEHVVRTFASSFAEFRISYSSYPRGFANQEAYQHDLANLLRTYRPLIEVIGLGDSSMRVELHTRPLVQISDNFSIESIDGHLVVNSGSYLVISEGRNIELREASITGFRGHHSRIPVFTEKGVPCVLYVSDTHLNQPDWRETARKLISHQGEIEDYSFLPHHQNEVLARKALMYNFSNADGPFLSLDPTLDSNGYFNAFHFYPRTESRFKSGTLDTSRFILNAILQYKRERGIDAREPFPNATTADMHGVVAIVEQRRYMYAAYSSNTSSFIDREILPLLRCFIGALTEADYLPSFLFDWRFLNDTGVINNDGRAISEFKGLISKVSSPIDAYDTKRVLLNKDRGQLWRWAPVPYRGNSGVPERVVSGWKNQLVDIPGIVEVCPIDRTSYEPDHAGAFYIFGVPMEQVSFKSISGYPLGPGSV